MAEILEQEGYRVRFKAEVPAEEVERAFREVIEAYRRRVRVPGFRPGKVPEKVLIARIGEAALIEEVRERLLDKALPEAIKALGLNPVAITAIEGDLKRGAPFVFEVALENYPEVKLPQWKRFKLKTETPEITDEIVDEAIEDLRDRYAEVEAVDRPAAEGDVVLVATDQGEVPVALDKAPEPVRAALVGKKAGDAVELPVLNEKGETTGTLPGTVKEVREVRRPALDEDFAKTLGYETLEEARAKIREALERRAQEDAFEAKKTELLNRLAEGLKGEVPPSLVAEEERAIWQEIAEDLAKKGIPFEDYLKQLEAEEKLEALKEDVKKGALMRVKRGLALDKLIEQQKTELTEEEWQAHLEALARRYNLPVPEFERAVGEKALRQLYVRRLHDKALEEAVRAIEAA